MTKPKNDDDVQAPTHLDGSPIDAEEAANVHSRLKTGEMKIAFAPGVREEMEAMGLTEDKLKEQMIKATGKRLS